jgi:hypothetical protein
VGEGVRSRFVCVVERRTRESCGEREGGDDCVGGMWGRPRAKLAVTSGMPPPKFDPEIPKVRARVVFEQGKDKVV